MKIRFISFTVLLLLQSICFGEQNRGRYDVRAFGATGDGQTLDTESINAAIEAASANGGGTIYFPPGTYLSFSIRLKSNISLYFENGSTLVAASQFEHDGRYDPPEPNVWGDVHKYQDFGHSHWHNSLIWGEGLENISITGTGLIWGKGLTLKNEVPEGGGNKTIALKECRNVIIRDVSIAHGGHFAILASGIDNLTLDNLKIDTNRDGIDIDCCRNVRVSNCTVNAPGDDAICLKSSYGHGYARATENVTITNCIVSGYDEGTMLDGTYKTEKSEGYPDNTATGRIKFGTESNGGFKNIAITNCLFYHCRGIALETVDGGALEDVTISNIVMRDILNAPIFLRLGARMRGPEGVPVGTFKRVSISNVTAYDVDSRFGVMIMGIPDHPIEDVSLSNIRIYHKGGGTEEMAKIEPKIKIDGYPEPFIIGKMPSHGFFVRYAKTLTLSDVQIFNEEPDMRPLFVLDNVVDADFFRIKSTKHDDVPIFRIRDSERINIDSCRHVDDQDLLSVEQLDL